MRATCCLVVGWCVMAAAAEAQEREAGSRDSIEAALAELSAKLAADPQRDELRQSLGRALRDQITEANRRSSAEWFKVITRQGWESFRDSKLKALRASLNLPSKAPTSGRGDGSAGASPSQPATPKILVTGELAGEGYKIRNLVYQSRPGLVVTANLYVPDPPRSPMPGILLSHSHHNPKHEGELQDMGMTWARAGCYVLVPDHLGHGERRQHPFESAADYDQPFPVGRQDYNFRYDTSLQLYLVGESLMGWMVHDLMTGVDVLLAQPGIDARRIILLGAVAGGGDPAVVTAALDERIACVVPFNFGGPQPENRYPLPEDAETTFNYAGGGSWESTRNLARSAADGFLPWVIVGSVAPRKLIHAHEFSWDRERDPVWKRYEKIWGLYDAGESLAFTQGFGTIQNTSAPASHCNNIGPPHRKLIHEAFRRWFAIDVKPEDEYSKRRTREDLTCLTAAAREAFAPQPLHVILAKIADERLAKAREALAKLTPADQRKRLVEGWTGMAKDAPFGAWNSEPAGGSDPAVRQVVDWWIVEIRRGRDVAARRPGLRALVLRHEKDKDVYDRPLVIAIAAEGPAGFLKHRRKELAALLENEATIALVEMVGIGNLAPDTDHGQQSSETAHSATQLMLSRPLLAHQLRYLRSELTHCRMESRVDPARITVWGDSFAEALPADSAFRHPRRVDRPAELTPVGPMLALLLAASDTNVAGVVARGGLISQASLLDSPFVQSPHSSVLPGALEYGDLDDLVASLAPRPIVLERMVDGRNRLATHEQSAAAYSTARSAYANLKAGDRFILREQPDSQSLLEMLKWRSVVSPEDRSVEISDRK